MAVCTASAAAVEFMVVCTLDGSRTLDGTAEEVTYSFPVLFARLTVYMVTNRATNLVSDVELHEISSVPKGAMRNHPDGKWRSGRSCKHSEGIYDGLGSSLVDGTEAESVTSVAWTCACVSHYWSAR